MDGNVNSESVKTLTEGTRLLVTVYRDIVLYAVRDGESIKVHRELGRSNTYPARVQTVNNPRDGSPVQWIVLTYNRERIGMAQGVWRQLLAASQGGRPAITMKVEGGRKPQRTTD